ncbi:hypothetical protein DINM_022706 [Dirofilaria immitis]|nr:hypothetical protein [Dirofilaria immitis]
MRIENDEKFHDFVEMQKGLLPTLSDISDESSTNNLIRELLSGITGDTSLSLTIRGLPKTVKARGIKDWFSPIKLKGMKIVRDRVEALEITKLSNNRISDGNTEDYIHETREAEVEAVVGKILETGRLFVRNLPYMCSDEDLRYLFNKYGEISDLQCKGFAIVTYVFPESAVAAFSALDGSILKGRMLHILPGEEKREAGETSITDAGKSHSWNTLFLGANAVAETLAENGGVRLALAETQLVNETREYLLANGVDTDELKRMFARYGPVKQILMPLGGVTAILEMENSVDAQKAFSALAYSRFRSQPLFLEWAPYDVLKSGESENKNENKDQKHHIIGIQTEGNNNEFPVEDKKGLRQSKKHCLIEEPVEIIKTELQEKAIMNETTDDEDAQKRGEEDNHIAETGNEVNNDETKDDSGLLLPGTTLFVKNLSFKTTEERLKNKFESRFRIRSANISKKRDTADPTKTLSMGFGFIKFYKPEDAQQAIKEMQGVLLDGHCLLLKLSHKEIVPDKIILRKGIDELKQGEATKNAEKGNRADARRAFNALVHSTHFYGRRLVLEWAKPNSNLEELRESCCQFKGVNLPPTAFYSYDSFTYRLFRCCKAAVPVYTTTKAYITQNLEPFAV